MKPGIVEICCAEIEAVRAALKGGATRIELCSGISEGGVTPSYGLIRAAVESGIPEINVLIRPRPGDFIFNEAELRVMEADICIAVETGATGIVIGALTADGDIDIEACSRLIAVGRAAASAMGHAWPNVTFHRAFDVCRNPEEALEDVIALGCDCLLSSGQQDSAEMGIPLLRSLVEKAAGRIAIIAGSGVNPENAAAILSATGTDGIHSTAREFIKSLMRHRCPTLSFGEDRKVTTSETVTALISKV